MKEKYNAKSLTLKIKIKEKMTKNWNFAIRLEMFEYIVVINLPEIIRFRKPGHTHANTSAIHTQHIQRKTWTIAIGRSAKMICLIINRKESSFLNKPFFAVCDEFLA